VELQHNVSSFEAAGVTLVALSYDEQDALGDFASVNGIQFPLLSDPGSEVIGRFGILNTLIPEDDHPWRGIPFPGAYVLDGDGVIVAKFFENNLAARPSGAQLLRAALGEEVSTGERSSSGGGEVSCEVDMDRSPMPPGNYRDLIVRFGVPAGFHLYGEPVPEGMTAAGLVLDPESGLTSYGVAAPPTHEHLLATGECLQVYEGDVELRVRVSHNGDHTHVEADGGEYVTISGVVRWQACDDEQCGLPGSSRFSIELEAAPMNVSAMRSDDDDGENFKQHFALMRSRHGAD
jgi:hypothetical protein